AFEAAVVSMGQGTSLGRLAEAIGDGADVTETAAAIREALHARPLAAGLMQHIADEIDATHLLERYGNGLIARSSATVEASPTHSFAGIFESVLAEGTGEVEGAVRRVWASGFSDRAASYLRRTGIAPPEIAVLVQAFIDPPRSGVMRTLTRDADGRGRILIEHVEGRCHPLVLG